MNEDVACVYNGVLFNIKRWMDFEGITLGEINQRKTNTV